MSLVDEARYLVCTDHLDPHGDLIDDDLKCDAVITWGFEKDQYEGFPWSGLFDFFKKTLKELDKYRADNSMGMKVIISTETIEGSIFPSDKPSRSRENKPAARKDGPDMEAIKWKETQKSGFEWAFMFTKKGSGEYVSSDEEQLHSLIKETPKGEYLHGDWVYSIGGDDSSLLNRSKKKK